MYDLQFHVGGFSNCVLVRVSVCVTLVCVMLSRRSWGTHTHSAVSVSSVTAVWFKLR